MCFNVTITNATDSRYRLTCIDLRYLIDPFIAEVFHFTPFFKPHGCASQMKLKCYKFKSKVVFEM